MGVIDLDRKLLQHIKAGDADSFAELYNKYAEYTLRVAAAVTGSKTNAADAVQETFIRVYKNIYAFDLDKPFEPWLYRILINECNRIMGKNKNLLLMDDFLDSGLVGNAEDNYKFEKYESLYEAIKVLDDKIKVPIVLKYLKGFQENEIAFILETNINTIKSRLFKGRQLLKDLIQEFEGGMEYESSGR